MKGSASPHTPAAAGPSGLGRLLASGLLAGLIVNAVDIPNSALVVAPAWTRFLGAHGITLDVPLTSGIAGAEERSGARDAEGREPLTTLRPVSCRTRVARWRGLSATAFATSRSEIGRA
jgi:hypothetical protein